MAIVKNNDLLSKYRLKAYSRAARYFSNMCITDGEPSVFQG